MTVETPPRAGILCDGHLLALEPCEDVAGRGRIRLALVLDPYDGGHLRITVAHLLPRQARALADALRTLAEEVRDV